MITLIERQILDLHDCRSAQLRAEADRGRQRREATLRAAATADARVARWRFRLPRWVAVDITLRVWRDHAGRTTYT